MLYAKKPSAVTETSQVQTPEGIYSATLQNCFKMYHFSGAAKCTMMHVLMEVCRQQMSHTYSPHRRSNVLSLTVISQNYRLIGAQLIEPISYIAKYPQTEFIFGNEIFMQMKRCWASLICLLKKKNKTKEKKKKTSKQNPSKLTLNR